MLDVCLLGTGGMMPLPGRWLTSLLVRYDGSMILIDCGEGTQIPMKLAGWGFKALDAILLTHYHADHCAGLPGLLLTLGNSGRDKPLLIMGPPGLKQVLEGLMVVCPELPYEIRYGEWPLDRQGEFNMNAVTIRSLPVEHAMPCLAYAIELRRNGQFLTEKAQELGIPVRQWKVLQKGDSITHNGRIILPEEVTGTRRKGIKLCYCTDTRPVEGLTAFIDQADLFICEGMYGEDESRVKADEKMHMLFSDAARLASSGHVRELWLTHYSPSLINPCDFVDNAVRHFSNTHPGKDLMKKTLTFQREEP